MKSSIAGKTVMIVGTGGLAGGVARYLSGQRCRLVLVAGSDASVDELVTELRWNGVDVTHVVASPARAATIGSRDALPDGDGAVDAVVDIAGGTPASHGGYPGSLRIDVFAAQAHPSAPGAAIGTEQGTPMPWMPSASFRIGAAIVGKIDRAARRVDVEDGWGESPREYLDLIGKLVAHAIEFPRIGVLADMWIEWQGAADPGTASVCAA